MGDLHRVNNPLLDQVAILQGVSIEAFTVRQILDPVNHNSAVETSVVSNPERGFGQRVSHGLHPDFLVALELIGKFLELPRNLNQHGATTSNNAFLRGSTSGVDGVLDAQLALRNLSLRGTAGLHHGHAAGELSQALFQLLAIPRGIRLVNLATEQFTSGLKIFLGAATVDDDGLILRHGDATSGTEVGLVGLAQAEPDFLIDDGCTGDHSKVVHEGLATVAEVWRLHGAHVQALADRVHDQHRERFALNILGNDQDLLAGLSDFLQHWEEIRQ